VAWHVPAGVVLAHAFIVQVVIDTLAALAKDERRADHLAPLHRPRLALRLTLHRESKLRGCCVQRLCTSMSVSRG
jgi:hypothetical protein